MKIGVAQIEPKAFNIEGSFLQHQFLIEEAAKRSCDFLVFPELSLTGYEPKHAEEMSLKLSDPIFKRFQNLSDQNSLGFTLGFPLKCNREKPKITNAIFQPFQELTLYSKQYLHQDEIPYFSSGTEQILINLKEGQKIAPAICYESLLPEHAAEAAQSGAQVYCASVAKSQVGIEKAKSHYPLIAKKHKMIVVMANFVGQCDDSVCAGQSGIWGIEGEVLGQLGQEEVGVLVWDVVVN